MDTNNSNNPDVLVDAGWTVKKRTKYNEYGQEDTWFFFSSTSGVEGQARPHRLNHYLPQYLFTAVKNRWPNSF